jgi:hypothetical protein
MKYNIESIQKAYSAFIQANGYEPTAKHFDMSPDLPGSRYIQRNYGGLKEFRQALGASIPDHTKGASRKATAKVVTERAREYEKALCNGLMEKHHNQKTFNPAVIRQFAYQQWIPDDKYYENIRCDVAISYRDPSHIILIDFFYPSDMHYFGGCVRSKVNKLKKSPPSLGLYDCTYEVVFVCVNPDIGQEQITEATRGLRGFTVQSLATFKEKWGV